MPPGHSWKSTYRIKSSILTEHHRGYEVQKTQKTRVFATAAALALSLPAFGEWKTPTVADYMHDIDKARVMNEKGKNDYAKYKDDPAVMNAAAALAKLSTQGPSLKECWGGSVGKASTATTDHACLDAKGYKR